MITGDIKQRWRTSLKHQQMCGLYAPNNSNHYEGQQFTGSGDNASNEDFTFDR